ncbi:MAG: flagellar hook-basal body protein [Planctomycetes bacterium]|nr:flagellar hook-basal body protein [Planctomycetota bacterium]
MLYGLYLSATGMIVQRHQHEVIANNMANVGTTAFKRDVATFRMRLPESQSSAAGMAYREPLLDRIGGGTFVSPSYTEFTQGEVEKTNRPLDVCLKGPGFFTVRDDQGGTFYTRDGRFALDTAGRLTTLDGECLVLDAVGQTIELDKSRSISISGDGLINQDGQPAGQLSVVEFSDPQVLRKVGNSLFENTGAAPERMRSPQLVSGALERSCSDPVRELVSMIEAQRAYEANARMVTVQNDTLGRVVNDLARNV